MVVAVHGGDSHPCVAVVVILYDYIHAWWLWSIMNDYRGYTSSQEKKKRHERKKSPQMDLNL